MCGDSIIMMCNVKYAKKNTNRNTLTKGIVLTSAKRLLEQILLRSTNKVRKVLPLENAGTKTQKGKKLRTDIEVNLEVRSLLLKEPRGTTKGTLKRRSKEIRNMGIVGVVIMQVTLTGKRLMGYLTYAVSVVVTRILPSTTLNHFQREAQTILKTYKNYAEDVMQVRGINGIYL